MTGRAIGCLFGILMLLAAAAIAAKVGDMTAGIHGVLTENSSPELIAKGEYLAKVGDCGACHSVPGRPPFSGGLGIRTPVGTVYTTNITPDATYGIGDFTLADFDRAVRFGVSRERTLYPAMPYTSYRNLAPEDVSALFAYFREGVPAAAIANRRNAIPFPLSMRWPLTYWRWLFARAPEPYVAPAGSSPSVARGGYLVEGLGHCGECHTPRNAALALRALTAGDGNRFLAGALIEGYFAPSLRSEGPGSLADWTEEDIARFLQTSANRHAISFASMSEVIERSTQHLTHEDALAMAAYLKTLEDPGASAPAFVPDEEEHSRLMLGDASKPGALIYLNNCAACHRPDGKGYEGVFPSLAGNPVVLAERPDSVIAIILRGATTPRTATTPARFTMPALHWRIGDAGVAQVASFVRSSWGNQASAVTAADVRKVRARLDANAAR